ncbi:MAG: hypothetical protein ACO1RT_05135 [Planctomycetaceae bacterium]
MENQHEPGTLVWVGDHSRPEFADAFRFCRDHVAQIATRRSPRELLNRPAGFVRRLLFSRADRRPLPPALFTALTARYRDSQWLALCSALCDGESRTGEPWPGVRQVRFSRWNEVLPTWLEPCGHVCPPTPSLGALLVISDRYETAEPYLDMAASTGHTVFWNRHFNRRAVRNVQTVLWDDSLAPPAAADRWRQRLGGPADASLRHVWLVTQPQAAEIKAAISGGISQVLTKPIALGALFA